MSKPTPDRHAPQEVDAYLAAQEPAFRATLAQLRALIRAVAPHCTERVSYKIPIFRLQQDFVAISAAKQHCGLHTMSKAVPQAMRDELKAAGIRTSGATLHIKTGSDLPVTTGSDLPVTLIEKALRARLAEMAED